MKIRIAMDRERYAGRATLTELGLAETRSSFGLWPHCESSGMSAVTNLSSSLQLWMRGQIWHVLPRPRWAEKELIAMQEALQVTRDFVLQISGLSCWT